MPTCCRRYSREGSARFSRGPQRTADHAQSSAHGLTRIGNGFGLEGCSLFRCECLAQLLRCLCALAARLVNSSLRYVHVDYSPFDQSASFESVHLSSPRSLSRLSCFVGAKTRRKSANGKSPTGSSSDGASSLFKSLAVTYSCMPKGHTTIGAKRFHFRVRYGIGWFPLAIAARQTGSRAADFAVNRA
jgi:hypothetical protein